MFSLHKAIEVSVARGRLLPALLPAAQPQSAGGGQRRAGPVQIPIAAPAAATAAEEAVADAAVGRRVRVGRIDVDVREPAAARPVQQGAPGK